MYECRFTFLYSKEEKANLVKLASFHHRSPSDVIRMLIREAIRDLSISSKTGEGNPKGSKYDYPNINRD